MRLTDLLTVSFSSGLWTDKERNKILNEKNSLLLKVCWEGSKATKSQNEKYQITRHQK